MSSRPLIVSLLMLPLLAGGCDRQLPPAEQPNASAAAAAPVATSDEVAPGTGTAKVIRETIGTLERTHKGEPASGLVFTDPAGNPATLASFAGKPVLLNLWATWCAPCVAEMPTLDRLAASLDGKVTILTVSQDLEGVAKVKPFFEKAAFTHLKPWLDQKAALSIAYQANLPTTILFDSKGNEVWRMVGGMDWTGTKAAELIAEAK